MYQRLKVFAGLRPYYRENQLTLLLGAIALIIANYLDVKVLVLLGDSIDLVGWNLGPFADFHVTLVSVVLATLAAMVLTAAVARFYMRWLIIGASRQIEFRLRNDLFAHLQRLSPKFYNANPTGDIMARATNDLEAVRLVVGPSLMYLASTGVMLPMSIYQQFHISPRLTILCWLPLALIGPLFYFFSKRIHTRFTRVQESFSTISTRVQEILTGIRVVKAYAREDQEAARFEKLSQQYVDENIGLTWLQAFFIPMMSFIVGLTLMVMVWAGGFMMAQPSAQRLISPGELISFFTLLMANIWPIAAIGWVFSLLERGSASMTRINALMETQPDVRDSSEVIEALDEDAPRPVLRGEIEIRDLTFAYPGSDVPAIVNMSVKVPAGSRLGLTGPVGSGKSTLAHLLARRYNAPRGTVFLDGIDLLDWPLQAYRERLGVVDQEPFLFSDTIASNILYGVPTNDEAVLSRAIETAQFVKDVPLFPQGLNTLLGERGINLSGGQRQRATLARALATHPALLVLDDALSAVDTHTEEDILRGLIKFMEGRTTVLISHRISTVSIADHILYLENGRVVEEGTHEELMKAETRYWTLARKQQLAQEIEATA